MGSDGIEPLGLEQPPFVVLEDAAQVEAALEGAPGESDEGRRPVIFVHGVVGFRHNLLPMRSFFARRGFGATWAVGSRPGLELAARAASLAAFIRRVGEVDLVAHGVGGLVARLALASAEIGAAAGTLITLGTPHVGGYAARFGYERAWGPPDEATQQVLDAQVPWSGSPRLIAFWSPDDLLVQPPTGARLEGAREVEVPGLTQYSYLLNPQIWQLALELLTES